MNGSACDEAECSEFVEVDPTGRYGRYNEILGKGAAKTVYRAFDEYEGIEVAWNQVKLYDFLQSPEDLERLYCEIHLLKTLKHENIMKFYTSWVDTTNRNINFVTEMFISGTLRQYRLKHRNVNIRAVKHWCRQIIKGLLYLHSHHPPVIHRDLKCDNIFINGNQGQVKIGDLGLAAILRKSHAARCVGTPEFMAPEVYAEEYNELVDIYSFGMCVLEMVTLEYPYSECTHPAQIYKKVISGKKPEALYKVKDPEVRQFVEKCLATVSLRLNARELLEDPFLQIDDYGFDMKTLQYELDFSYPRQLCHGIHDSSLITDYAGYYANEPQSEFDYLEVDDENLEDIDITINGRRQEDDGIFLRLRIADKEGRVRNIYFPFDIETDTALSVANEMVAELGITDQDVTQIADMIDGEIASLVPEWNRGPGTEMVESSNCGDTSFCQDCASERNFPDYASFNGHCAKNLQVLNFSRTGCTAAHGRFEEITYQVEGSEQCATQSAPIDSSGQGFHYADILAQRDKPILNFEGSRDIHCDGAPESPKESNLKMDDQRGENTRKFSFHQADYTLWEDYENEIRQELRWLKAKYQLQLRELKNQQLRVQLNIPSIPPPKDNSLELEHKNGSSSSRLSNSTKLKLLLKKKPLIGPSNPRKQLASCCSDWENMKRQMVPDVQNRNQNNGSDHNSSVTASNDFYKEALLPQTLHRATSLPVDAVDV